MGGLYRDQGNEVASKWLRSLLKPHVKAAYRIVREVHLLPPAPETDDPPQLEAPIAYGPSFFSSGGAGPALPSYPGEHPFGPRQLTVPEANVPRETSAQAGDAVDTRAVVDKPRSRRRRRRSSAKDGGGDGAGKQGTFSSMRGLLNR